MVGLCTELVNQAQLVPMRTLLSATRLEDSKMWDRFVPQRRLQGMVERIEAMVPCLPRCPRWHSKLRSAVGWMAKAKIIYGLTWWSAILGKCAFHLVICAWILKVFPAVWWIRKDLRALMRRPCKFFRSTRGCKAGDKCRPELVRSRACTCQK